jgi:hypothetical protein
MLKEIFYCPIYREWLSAIGTFGVVIVSLWLALRKPSYYKIKNILSDWKGEELSFYLYNLKEVPLEIKFVLSEPNTFIYKNGCISHNTKLDLVEEYKNTPYLLFGSVEQIDPYAFKHYKIRIPYWKIIVKNQNNKPIGILKQKKLIIVTNFGRIILSYPRPNLMERMVILPMKALLEKMKKQNKLRQ